MSTQVAQDLRAAAEVLRRDGWQRGALHERNDCGGRHCVRGAIHVATGVVAAYTAHDDEQADAAYRRAADAERLLEEHLFGTPDDCSVVGWNDFIDTTADEVIAALEAAADAAEQVTA